MVCMTVIRRSSFRRWKEALAPQAETSDLSQKLRFKVHSTSIGNKCMHWSGLLVTPLHSQTKGERHFEAKITRVGL